MLLKKNANKQTGSILPIVAIGLTIFAVFVAFSLDIMRTIHAKSAMNFACKAAALAAYAFDPNEPRFTNNASADLFNNPNIAVVIAETLANQSALYSLPKNMIPAGPDWTKNIFFAPAIFQFNNNNLIANPTDPNELLLRVPIQTNNANGLQMFFFPAMFISNWGNVAANTQMANPVLVANEEVIGQPASRIGAGPTAAEIYANPKLAAFADCAVFPLAITYADFIGKILPAPQNSKFFFVLNSNTNTNSFQWQIIPNANYPIIRTALIDVAGFPSKQTYYDYNLVDNISDLQNILPYFLPGYTGLPPGCVERGSNLPVIDPASLNNQQLQNVTGILAKLQNGTKHYFILPVVSQNLPGNSGQPATVLGFALMKSQTMIALGQNKFQFVFSSVGSIPLKNASSSNDRTVVPQAFNGSVTFGRTLPPVYPFNARQYIQFSNAINLRPTSVALAPSLSARSPFHFFTLN